MAFVSSLRIIVRVSLELLCHLWRIKKIESYPQQVVITMNILKPIAFLLVLFSISSCEEEEQENNNSQNSIVGTWGWYESWQYSARPDGTVCDNSLHPESSNLSITYVFNADGTYSFNGIPLETYSVNSSTGKITLNNPPSGHQINGVFFNVNGNPFNQNLNFPPGTITPCIYQAFDHSSSSNVGCGYKTYLQYHFKKLD